jgi:hypothetical protein
MFWSVAIASAQPLTGVFTSPWYLPNTPLLSAYDGQLCRPPCVSQSVAAWQNELTDMAAAGVQFFAPYSFGKGSNWADPANFLPNMVTALNAQSAVKIAFFQDTNGVPIRANQACGFDLAGPEATTKQYVYTDDIKLFFDAVPVSKRFTYTGRPLLFFYKSYPLFKNREYLGLLLAKVREWFIQDYQVNPILIVEKDWDDSITAGTPNSCNPAQPPTSPMSQAAIDSVRQNADAFYSWEFIGTVGQKGVTSVLPTGSGFPGGGVVTTHPTNGVTVGTAGVGYYYATATGVAARDRRNGLTLTEDWNAIRGASLRMVAAWWDYDEASGISRDNTTGTKYIDLMNQLIIPQTPTLASFAVSGTPPPASLRTSVGGTIVATGTKFLPGAVAEFAPVAAPTQVTTLPMTYVSPTSMTFAYGGGAPPGNYFVKIRNSDNTVSQQITITVSP